MTENLRRMLAPDTIAVVGASHDETKRGYRTIENLQAAAFDGWVCGVNPKHEGSIRGVDVYPTVRAIPRPIDLAFVVTPAAIVPSVLRDCVEASVAGAVVIAAGFEEVGNGDLEAEVAEIVDGSDLRLIGPNIQGVINTHDGVDLIGGYQIPVGRVGLLTQSGNVGVDMAETAAQRRSVGFSYNIGLGNELDVKCHEYLPVLRDDPNTDVVAAYVEGLAEGRTFLRAAKEVVPDLPIVLLKGGKSRVGRQSVSSHTASLAGDHAAVDAALRQAGVTTVARSDALLPTAESIANLPAAAGDRIGVLTDGGGHATIAVDALDSHDLDTPALSDETADAVRAEVPTASNLRNPVDIMGQGGDLRGFSRCADALLRDPSIDALLVTGAFGGYSTYEYLPERDEELEAARELVSLVDEHDKPIVVHSYYHDSPTLDLLRSSDVTVCHSVETACECLAGLVGYGEALADRHDTTDFPDLPSGGANLGRRVGETDGRRQFSEHASRRLLADHDVPFVRSRLVTSREEAVAEAERTDGPAAMKVSSPDIVHKTDAGCVALDVTADAAAGTYDRLLANAREHDPGASIDGVMVSPMVEGDVELLVGATVDPEVGPVLVFGLGGIFVEVLEDVAFRTIPLTHHDARELVRSIRGADLLRGARGSTPVGEDALVSFLLTVSDAVAAEPIAELDLNPVVATGAEIRALDASVTLRND